MMKSKVDIKSLSNPAMAAPKVASHVLQEPDIPMPSKDIHTGRAITDLPSIRTTNIFSKTTKTTKTTTTAKTTKWYTMAKW